MFVTPPLKSLPVSVAAAAAVFALGALPYSPTAVPAYAVTSEEPTPSAKKKATKPKKAKTKKTTKAKPRKAKTRKRRGKRPARKQNFGSSSSLYPGLQPQAPRQLTYLKFANSQLQAGEYRDAIVTLNGLNRPEDPNVLNLLGYSHRKLGLIDVGMRYYLAALKRNPQHRGVHEYLGEAYLQKDDLGKAEVMLKKLAGICGTDCREYKELANAIVVYKGQRDL